MDKLIFHIDVNSAYLSWSAVEKLKNGSDVDLREIPSIIGGDIASRHGIVLAKNGIAKRWGIKTAETLWQARRKCPDLVVVPPNYRLYLKVSRLARRIYCDYTDQVEPFGPDEAWLDITCTLGLYGGKPRDPWSDDSLRAAGLIASEVSERVKAELGLTVSVGASWNKIFAKFGSDYQKHDAITFVTPGNYRQLVWEAPVRDLLYVGPATERKLHAYGIRTIGQLAQASDAYLQRKFGKIGFVLRTFARGEDATPVKPYDPAMRDVNRMVKSYGNGLTAPHPITTAADAKALIWILSESVAQRMREDGMRARTIAIGVRNDTDLTGYGCQMKLPQPSAATRHVAQAAWALLCVNEPFDEEHPIRALHVRATDLVEPAPIEHEQLSLFTPDEPDWERLDLCIDDLRRRFGNTCIVRGTELLDESLAGLDIKDENTVHPVGYFHR